MPFPDKDWSKMLRAYDRILEDRVIQQNKSGRTVSGKALVVLKTEPQTGPMDNTAAAGRPENQ